MKLGLVIYGSLDTVSGGYLYDRKLVQSLRAAGDSVEIISLPWRNYAAHLIDNFYFRLPKRFDLILQDELNHPSLVAANRAAPEATIVSIVHHLCVSESHSRLLMPVYRAVEKAYVQSVQGFIFNSHTTQQVVSELLGRSPEGLIANPPTDRFGEAISEADIRDRARSTEFRIVFLGNIIERKGLHVLLRAMMTLDDNVRLDVVGSTRFDTAYNARINRLVSNKLAPRVTFHGTLDDLLLQQILRNAHMLVVPSSYEGFGIAYLEGMCFGLPAIGTTSGAAHEIISDGIDGYLVPPGDAAMLAIRILALAKDRELLVRLSLNARARYHEQPSWNATAAHIREFLLSMLQ